MRTQCAARARKVERYCMSHMTDDQLLNYAAGLGAAGEDEVASVDRGAASVSSTGVPALEVARAAADAAAFKGAEDICVVDLTELSDVCDYFVIATGSNTRMVDAIVDEVEEGVAKACGEHPFSIEGREERTWILMDYGSVVVHSFTPEAREFYRLEKLWADAPVVEL